ncbi:hypothetical protein F5884DRAFT_824465 [Xylogone sp. PMI_703]|nr:hypothetical protein F5884DRAFT_824465 [Xylogone sp. PMI_703]
MSSFFHECSREILDETAYREQLAAEIVRLRSQINDEAVSQYVSSLSGGRSCRVEHFSAIGPGALMGSGNYHARIHFHDGSPSWLLRVPRVASFAAAVPPSLVEHLIRSEYATLKFLESTAVPAPRAFGYGMQGFGTYHGVGVNFILIEELRGVPWTGQGMSGSKASEDKKAKIWSGLADILIELQRHPFAKAGSLCIHSSKIGVSTVASDRFLVFSPAGPFDTSAAYYAAFAEQHLELIADGQLYTEYPVNAYLVYRFLKDNAAQLVSHEGGQVPERFYLKHVDDKGDHLLVDDQLNITGIVDWQMARVVPSREAFGPSLTMADMDALCNGRVSLSTSYLVLADMLRARGLPDVAGNMADEKVRRCFWGLALEPVWAYALPLANAIFKCFWKWKGRMLSVYENDERLKSLISHSSSEPER